MDHLNYMEKQLTPSLWSKRFATSQEVISHHIKYTTEKTKINQKLYNYKANIQYGPNERQMYDLYFQNTENGSPIFVYIHGGFWQELNKNISGYCVGPLIEIGYRVIIIGYTLCPDIKLHNICHEIQTALCKIFEYANETNTPSVSICGHSAGAHLIMNCFLNNSLHNFNLLKCVFLISGIYDLTDLWKTKSVNPNNILGINDEINAKKLSPLFVMHNQFLAANLCKNVKFYIYVGENDSDVFQKQSELLHHNLITLQFPSNFQILSGYDHFDIVENLTSNQYEITQLIIEKL